MPIPTDEIEDDILGVASATCEQLRAIHGAEPKFMHLPEVCEGCNLLRNRIRTAYEIGYKAGEAQKATDS